MKKAIFLLVLFLIGSALWAQNRYALVIGNAAYPRTEDRLPNAINDTTDITNELRTLGYQVELKHNLQNEDMIRAVDDFISILGNNRDSEGFFWYAGHAMEINGTNYLLPLNVNMERDSLIRSSSFSFNELTERLGRVQNKVNVVVLDACRTPPPVGSDATRSGGGDLSRAIKTVERLPSDMLVIYSTASGMAALDGVAGRRNSPFTEAFLKHINSAEPLTLMIGRVTNETFFLTNQRQRPYFNGSIIDTDYSLNPSGAQPPPAITGNITVTSTVAGEILIDGQSIRPNRVTVREGGTVTISNLETGMTEISVRAENGNITRAAERVMVRQGQTVSARIDLPVTSGMMRIQGGTFTMGSPANESGRNNDETQYRVTVSSFYMSRYIVTQAEYQAVMGTNPSYFVGDKRPVEYVSWYDAIEYCNALSLKEGLIPAYTIDKSLSDPNNTNSSERDNVRWLVTLNRDANGYRLPTEAEWEYACRAGTRTPFSTGDKIAKSQANYYDDSLLAIILSINLERTTNVGIFAPNAWGLYDMYGNVWELCWDWYGTYPSDEQTDPLGVSSGASRIVRGGSWSNYSWQLRSAFRNGTSPSYRDNGIGFRVVRN